MCGSVRGLSGPRRFLIHQVFLGETYAALSSVWRPEEDMMSKMWIMWITSAVWAVLFCYIFTRGYDNKWRWKAPDTVS